MSTWSAHHEGNIKLCQSGSFISLRLDYCTEQTRADAVAFFSLLYTGVVELKDLLFQLIALGQVVGEQRIDLLLNGSCIDSFNCTAEIVFIIGIALLVLAFVVSYAYGRPSSLRL